MKATFYTISYLALLLPTMLLALNRLVDTADPAVVTQDSGRSFWLSGLGQCIWFGGAFLLPALVLVAFHYVMSRVWKSTAKDSHGIA